MDEVLLKLAGEKMYVETIFRERDGDEDYCSWYSVQDKVASPSSNQHMPLTKSILPIGMNALLNNMAMSICNQKL